MPQEGYPPTGALAPIRDGRSLALVGPDGGLEFFCPLRFAPRRWCFRCRTRAGCGGCWA